VCFLLRFVQKSKQSALSRHRFRSPQKKSKPHRLKSVPQNPHRIETRRMRLLRICEQKSNPHLLEISDGKALSNGRTRLANLRARLRIPNHQSPATSHQSLHFTPLPPTPHVAPSRHPAIRLNAKTSAACHSHQSRVPECRVFRAEDSPKRIARTPRLVMASDC